MHRFIHAYGDNDLILEHLNTFELRPHVNKKQTEAEKAEGEVEPASTEQVEVTTCMTAAEPAHPVQDITLIESMLKEVPAGDKVMEEREDVDMKVNEEITKESVEASTSSSISDSENNEEGELGKSSEDDSDLESLTREERARILEDGFAFTASTAVPPRTQHEVMDVPCRPRTDIHVPSDAVTRRVGRVSHVVKDTVIVVSEMSGAYVLNLGSVLILSNRAVLGEVFDTFGPVAQPRYSVRFAKPEEITQLAIIPGIPVHCVVQQDTFIEPHTLYTKGTDASNNFDEEVDQDELDFSNDEAEMAHKGLLKQKKKGLDDAFLKQSRPFPSAVPPQSVNSSNSMSTTITGHTLLTRPTLSASSAQRQSNFDLRYD